MCIRDRKSEVRKKILDENNINCIVEPSNLDEDEVKKSLINQGATPELISKNLAELKANKVSQKRMGEIVLGADSVIDLNGKLISTLFEGYQNAGNKLFTWDGTNHIGQKITTGVYIYRLQVNGVDQNRKMIYLK